jgi:hypothetical protein
MCRLVSLRAIKTTGHTTQALDGLQWLWSGCLSSTSDTHGVPVPGSSSLRSGHFRIVRMALRLVLVLTGEILLQLKSFRNYNANEGNRMNNFIVGQVTPDMLTHMTYGTYIFFGILTAGGAAFIYFVLPETKGLSLEEMDILFGSVGVAEREKERWREVQDEVGLTTLLARVGLTPGAHHDSVDAISDEKPVLNDTREEKVAPVEKA